MGLGNTRILLGLVLNDLPSGSRAVLCVGLTNPHYWGKTYLKTLSITPQSMSFSRLTDEIKALFLPYVSIALFLSLAWGRFLKWVHWSILSQILQENSLKISGILYIYAVLFILIFSVCQLWLLWSPLTLNSIFSTQTVLWPPTHSTARRWTSLKVESWNPIDLTTFVSTLSGITLLYHLVTSVLKNIYSLVLFLVF